MPNRIDPAMHRMQYPSRYSAFYRAGSNPERQQLPASDDAVLSGRQVRNLAIPRSSRHFSPYRKDK
jgi:hypothetical protein